MKYKPSKISWIHITTASLMLVFSLGSCTWARFVWYNVAEVDDYKHFDTRSIKKSTKPYSIPYSVNPVEISSFMEFEGVDAVEQFRKSGTLAMIVIRDDSIVYEKYFNGHKADEITGSFSMAKSVVSMLIGKAIEEGYIKSVHDPITEYLPELSEQGFDDIEILHLLQMTSGIDFEENYYSPFADAAELYYTPNLWKSVQKLKTKTPPGEQFYYSSGDTQLLGFVLARALGDQTISGYLQEKIWQPIGAQHDACWMLDSHGMERAFAGVTATALDFAKLGLLMLHEGRRGDEQLLSIDWVAQSTALDTSEASARYYQYQWWLPSYRDHSYSAIGYRGQMIYIDPTHNTVIVRLGTKQGGIGWSSDVAPLISQYVDQ